MRPARRPLWVLDSGLALALVVFVEVAARQPWDDGHRAGSIALNTPLVALAVLPLALRRTAPKVALVLVVLAMGAPSLVVAHDLLFWGGFLPLLLVLFTAARADDSAFARWCWLTGPVLFALEIAHVPSLRTPNEVGFDVLVAGAAWLLGRGLRRLDRQEHELSTALATLEDRRTAREADAVDHERSRIAGEMHDVVAHAVSLMVLQVGAARLEVETAGGSSTATAQLREAERAGRDAVDQLRRSLAVLRAGAP